jgi:hypothetical protein
MTPEEKTELVLISRTQKSVVSSHLIDDDVFDQGRGGDRPEPMDSSRCQSQSKRRLELRPDGDDIVGFQTTKQSTTERKRLR